MVTSEVGTTDFFCKHVLGLGTAGSFSLKVFRRCKHINVQHSYCLTALTWWIYFFMKTGLFAYNSAELYSKFQQHYIQRSYETEYLPLPAHQGGFGEPNYSSSLVAQFRIQSKPHVQQLGSWKEAPVAHVPQWILTPVETSACSLQLEVDSWRLNLLWEKIWFLALEINFICTDSKCGKQKCLL